MITMTITNVSSTASIGLGTSYLFPDPYGDFTIAASGTKALVMRVQDLSRPAQSGGFSGFTVGDELQKMVNSHIITISFANLAATLAQDVLGDAVAAET